MAVIGLNGYVTQEELDALPIGAAASYFISAYPSEIPGYGSFTGTVHGLAEHEYSAVLAEPDTEYLIAAFVTNGNFNATHIPAGLWSAHISGRVSATGGVTKYVFRHYKRTSGGIETELFSFETAEINDVTTTLIETDYVKTTDDTLDVSDEFVVKVFGKTTSGADRTIYLTVDGTGHASHIVTTMGSGFDPSAAQTIMAPWDFSSTLTKSGRLVPTVETGNNASGFWEKHYDNAGAVWKIVQYVSDTTTGTSFKTIALPVEIPSGGRLTLLPNSNTNGVMVTLLVGLTNPTTEYRAASMLHTGASQGTTFTGQITWIRQTT